MKLSPVEHEIQGSTRKFALDHFQTLNQASRFMLFTVWLYWATQSLVICKVISHQLLITRYWSNPAGFASQLDEGFPSSGGVAGEAWRGGLY